MYKIESEDPSHSAAIDLLLDLAFGPGRFAKSSYRLREGVPPISDLSFVGLEGQQLRGSIRFTPIKIGDADTLLLGPLVVHPDDRGKGLGIALMNKGIEQARLAGHRLVILVGDEPYYRRVGFQQCPVGRVIFPAPVDPMRVLYLELVDKAFEDIQGLAMRIQ